MSQLLASLVERFTLQFEAVSEGEEGGLLVCDKRGRAF
jgi:hypothetical protein